MKFFYKKGAIQEKLIILCIASLVLAFVLYGSGKQYLGNFEFFKNLPGFADNTQIKEGLEIVRYDITKDKVQWYDGERWSNFYVSDKEKKLHVVLNKKIIFENELKNIFFSYYFRTYRTKKIIDLNNNLYALPDSISEADGQQESAGYLAPVKWVGTRIGKLLGAPVEELILKKGDVVIYLYSKKDNSKVGLCVLSVDNKLLFVNEKGYIVNSYGDIDDSAKIKIKQEVIEWRDSIVNNPFKIKSGDIEGCFPIEKHYDLYLTVDFTKRLEDSKCGSPSAGSSTIASNSIDFKLSYALPNTGNWEIPVLIDSKLSCVWLTNPFSQDGKIILKDNEGYRLDEIPASFVHTTLGAIGGKANINEQDIAGKNIPDQQCMDLLFYLRFSLFDDSGGIIGASPLEGTSLDGKEIKLIRPIEMSLEKNDGTKTKFYISRNEKSELKLFFEGNVVADIINIGKPEDRLFKIINIQGNSLNSDKEALATLAELEGSLIDGYRVSRISR